MSELRNEPVQARSVARLADLIDAGRRAAVEVGYDQFTTKDVAERAHCSIGTVYRYFPDRVAVLEAIDSGRRVAADVRAEWARQNAKWGEQNHDDGTGPESTPLSDLSRRLGVALSIAPADDLAAAATDTTDAHAEEGTVTWADIALEEFFEALAESDPQRLRTELIQLSAVAQQWAEAIDRRGYLFRVRDIDNRGDDGPYEFVGDIAKVIGYLDGPLRRDTRTRAHAALDEAIAGLRNDPTDERLADVQRQFGVYITRLSAPAPVSDPHERSADL